MTRHNPGTPTPTFRQLLRQLADRIEELWPEVEFEWFPCEDDPPDRAFELYGGLLETAEGAAVTRARLTSRPHLPERVAQLKTLLAQQTDRRDRQYRRLTAVLDSYALPAPDRVISATRTGLPGSASAGAPARRP